MKLLILIYFNIAFCAYMFGQDTLSHKKIKFEFLKENKKIKKINKGKYLTLYFNDTTLNDSNINTYYHTFSGDIENLTDSFLVMTDSYENKRYYYKGGSYKEITYRGTEVDTIKKKIQVNQIKYIEYEPKMGILFNTVGGIGAITCLLVAPLASMNYSDLSKFNSKRYVNIMRPALITTCVGLTLHYSFHSRRLTIKK